MRRELQLAAAAALVAVALLATTGAAQTAAPTPAGTEIAYYTIRTNPYPNGNDAPTAQSTEASLQRELQQLLDPTQTGTVQIRVNESTVTPECDVVTQQCYTVVTFYFVGSQGSQFATELASVDAETAARTLQVTTFAEGTTVPDRSLSSEQTLTKFLVTVCAGYFGGSILLLCIFCIIRKRIMDSVDE